MSTSNRYFYVDSLNQAAGPIDLPELHKLRAAGTIQDTTLVVQEGGQDWVALSTIAPVPSLVTAPISVASSQSHSPQSNPEKNASPQPTDLTSDPAWARDLLQKMDRLTAIVDKLSASIERGFATRTPPIAAPATATLHAEKFNPNLAPKMGVAATLGTVARPPSTPGGPAGTATALAPLAVPANAVKSPLPLPSLTAKP
ncbi:MAG: DUF4339 domain-containing protein, partial [Verrucomicrobia bacterium]|nr:DUF4339 domain-containing protein [Verrucomicrobiota bacterium]